MKKYSDDYELIHTVDDKGRQRTRAEYRGDYYEVSLEESKLPRFKWGSLLLLVAGAALHVFGGFLNNQGMYQFYVVLPYAASFFPLFFMVESILRLPVKKRSYRRDEVEMSFGRIKSSGKILLGILGGLLLGEAIYLIAFSAPAERLLEGFFFLAEALAAVFAYFLLRLQNSVHVKIIEE